MLPVADRIEVKAKSRPTIRWQLWTHYDWLLDTCYTYHEAISKVKVFALKVFLTYIE